MPEVEGQGFFDLLDQVYRSGEAYTGFETPVQLRRAADAHLDQLDIDFVYQPIRDAVGEIIRIFVEGFDITERVRGRRLLARRESEFRALADNMSQLAWMAEANGWICWYNVIAHGVGRVGVRAEVEVWRQRACVPGLAVGQPRQAGVRSVPADVAPAG